MRLPRWINDKIGQAAVVHLKSGTSVQGYITESGRDFFVLVQAQVLGGDAAEMAGEAVVAREDVDFLQVLRRS